MSESERDNTKSIPVLKRKHVRTVEVPILELDKIDIGTSSDAPDFRAAVTKAVTESINNAMPSIIEDVLRKLEQNSK